MAQIAGSSDDLHQIPADSPVAVAVLAAANATAEMTEATSAAVAAGKKYRKALARQGKRFRKENAEKKKRKINIYSLYYTQVFVFFENVS